MATFTLGTAIGLNMNASFYADSVNAAARNKARLVVFLLVMYSCRFMKSTRLESFQRDCGIYGKRVRFTSKASIGNIGVFSLIEVGKEQYIVAKKANFKLVSECNWKNTFFYLPNVHGWLYEDKHWQSTCHDIQWGSSFPQFAILISDLILTILMFVVKLWR